MYSANPENNPNKLSCQVVKDAKEWAAAVTAVPTARPNTPKDSDRRLFRDRKTSRVPSAFSLGKVQFEPNDVSTKTSGNNRRQFKLEPLSQRPIIPGNSEPKLVRDMEKPMRSPALPKPENFHPSHFRIPIVSSVPNVPLKATLPSSFRPNRYLPSSRPANRIRNIHSAGDRFALTRNETAGRDYTNDCEIPRSYSATTPDVVAEQNKTYDNPEPLQSASASDIDSYSQSFKTDDSNSDRVTMTETADEAKYWNLNVLPLLEKIEDLELDESTLHQTCVKLYDVLSLGNYTSKMSGRRRTSLLSTLFKVLNGNSVKVQLACAAIVLGVRVHKGNLNSVCKVLFKLTREHKYDSNFSDDRLLRGMLSVLTTVTDPLENYETLVYLTGAIKFMTTEKFLSQKLAEVGCARSFIILTRNVMISLRNHEYQKKAKLHSIDILFQVTAVLRTMADLDKESFVCDYLYENLFEALDCLIQDENLALNISRLVSKLTMYDDVTDNLSKYEEWPKAIAKTLLEYKMNSDIVVRLCFALGNIAAKDENLRIVMHDTVISFNGVKLSFISVMNKLLEWYLQSFLQKGESEDVPSVNRKSRPGKISMKDLDVINKIIRVIANLSISENFGYEIASDPGVIGHILSILQQVQIAESGELIVNTLTTLNNLSYYSSDSSIVIKDRLIISDLLFKIIITDNMPCVMETSRVFGNLSQYSDVREFLHEHKIDRMMVTLLDAGKWQIVYSACGVLINMSADKANRNCLIQEGIISKLCDVLKDFAPLEWRLGGLVCQLLWNLCEDSPSQSPSLLSSEDADVLLLILHSLSKDGAPLKVIDTSAWKKDMQDHALYTWQTEFCPYSQRLYNKISDRFPQLIPIPEGGSTNEV